MKKILKRLSIIFVLLFVSGYLLLFFLPTPILLPESRFSKAVYDEQHHLLRLTLSSDEKYRLFTPLSKISPQLVTATLLQEDQYFRFHFGINPIATLKAFWQTYALKSRRMGASTITMQVARMRFGIHSKKISGKLWQMVKALQLEIHYSKDQILEAYLNLAPYGGNIEGVGAASLIYFGTSVDRLTLPQALILSIIPQNPGKRTLNNQDLKSIRAHLYQRWLLIHPEDANKKMMIDLPLVMQNNHTLPFTAPHFVNLALHDASQQNILTTLDSRVQIILERITRSYLARKRRLGVNNAAVLLVDTRDMGIKGMLGSSDFFNQEISGQIDGTNTKRSPGSALKPFIYGLAIDQGLIHPDTMLKDVPHSFNGYNPENFDYDFMGPIKAKDALVLSRNIPAIYLANLLRQPSLHQLLEMAHVSHLRSESFYGLSLSLGGVELTMQELVSLYVMLANDGLWHPLRLLQDDLQTAGVRLLSPEASFLVLDMLQNTPRVDVSYLHGSLLPVAWKTGTSSGYRDAWAVGVFGPYVLAVWVGNFDNSANPAFIGKDIAAPLFFELIDAIKQERGPLHALEKHPELMNLKKVEVCKTSGMLPTRYCQDKEWTWFIPGKSPIKTDTIYREVAINSKTGLRTCHIDMDTRFEVFEFWPSDLLQIFKKAGIHRRAPPFFEPECTLSGNLGINPQITSPQVGLSYIIRADSPHNNTIPFTAVTDAGIAYVYWFINDTFVAKTVAGKSFMWKAKPGQYVVRVVDEHGLSDARDLRVILDS
ncbi:MAG: penicillin-binding protein 1C [Legionella sp.]|uniref:penicillin-binding protein 1C n=1 Tax=Legionella sp. TaxID=459 RepID=UPI0039E4A810